MYAENQIPSDPKVKFKVLRWIAVLPGAILSMVLGTILIRMAVVVARSFAKASDDPYSSPLVWLLTSLPLETLEFFCDSFFILLITIVVAAKIAPAYKFPTGIGIGLLLAPIWTLVVIVEASKNRSGWNTVRLTITLLLGFVGIVAGLIQAYKEQLKATLNNEAESAKNSPLGKLQTIIVGSVVIALFGFGIYDAVYKKKVDVKTVEHYCSIRGDRSSNIHYDYEAIRNDFVKLLHDNIVKDFTGNEMSPNSFAVSEFIRLHMLGAWRDGNHLHIADRVTFALAENIDSSFRSWHSRLEETLKQKSGKEERSANNCLRDTINSLFDDVTLHGPGDRTAIIKLTR